MARLGHCSDRVIRGGAWYFYPWLSVRPSASGTPPTAGRVPSREDAFPLSRLLEIDEELLRRSDAVEREFDRADHPLLDRRCLPARATSRLVEST
jgi:hypothetical protein